MSNWSAFLDAVDTRLERDKEREPDYVPGRRTQRMANRVGAYRFMAARRCVPCGGENECVCPKEDE
jgi:hypothetical protein